MSIKVALSYDLGIKCTYMNVLWNFVLNSGQENCSVAGSCMHHRYYSTAQGRQFNDCYTMLASYNIDS